MLKPLARVPLQTGNLAAWFVVVLIIGFCLGWIVHVASRPLFCWFGV